MSDRIYVHVSSDFDATGYMRPRSITWPDGRVFQIEDIRAFRPSGTNPHLDCYTVVIRGREKRLYFERSSEHFASRVGRWYVEA